MARLNAFMDQHVYPNEKTFVEQVAEGDRWQPTKIMEELKIKAKEAGLWNLFLPESERGAFDPETILNMHHCAESWAK